MLLNYFSDLQNTVLKSLPLILRKNGFDRGPLKLIGIQNLHSKNYTEQNLQYRIYTGKNLQWTEFKLNKFKLKNLQWTKFTLDKIYTHKIYTQKK